jgi:hypothetical protein
VKAAATGARSAGVPPGAVGRHSSSNDGRCHTRARLATIALVVLAGIGAGCSSRSESTTHPTTSTTAASPKITAPRQPTTTTLAASTSTIPPVQTSSVEVGITGATVTLTFLSGLTGALSTRGEVFDQGGTVFTFVVTGVSDSGSTTTSPSVAGGLVSQVVVSPTNGGITVEVKLSRPASHYTFGLGHNEIGVMLS